MTGLSLTNQKIQTVIVDDEHLAREALVNYICDYCPEIEVIANCNSVAAAYRTINEMKPQLVFLDIKMPNGTGFDLLKMFNPIDFKVVFITAFSEYAIDAFRFTAVDYLLKPVKVGELIEAVAKVKRELKMASSFDQLLELLDGFTSASRQSKSLVISDANGFSVVKREDIILCSADSYCTNLFLVNNPSIVSTRNLKYFEEILDSDQFMRVHNSYIVNLDHVRKYTSQDEIFLTDNLKCPLSKVHKHKFQEYHKNKK